MPIRLDGLNPLENLQEKQRENGRKQANRRRFYLKNREKVLADCKKYRTENKDKYKNIRLKYKFGITLEDFNKILEKQGGGCVCCTSKYKLSLDHSHTTGKIRGILCMSCNLALGMVRDNKEVLAKLIS